MSLNIKLPADCETVICNFIRSKIKDSGKEGVVVGLSGGLDSAVIAQLCVNAIGKEKVTALLLPELKNTDEHFNDALDFAEGLGIRFHIIEIDPLIHLFLSNLKDSGTTNMALANLKARIRAVLLYFYANTDNIIVAGTSNKSELMIGYFTKYGDGGTDIAPIGDLYKTQVKMLAQKLKLPEKLITKPPTAGLLPNQTDEKELGMQYDVLDRILLGLELQVTISSISDSVKLPVSEVERIAQLSYSNRHKRKFSKIPKLGIKTIGTDLRE